MSDINPTPSEGLDNGSVEELARHCSDVSVDVSPRHAWDFAHQDIAVPERAHSLLQGMTSYGF